MEDKQLTLSVHFRMVEDESDAARVRDVVRTCARGHTGIRLTDGKKVVEIRPDVDWHKGRAFRFLRDTLEERFGRGPAVFIGDDRTDEDAFRELGDVEKRVMRQLKSQNEVTLEQIEKDTDRDYFLSGEQAVEYGIIDQVVFDKHSFAHNSREMEEKAKKSEKAD